MKAAIRLEISRKDIKIIEDKVNEIIDSEVPIHRSELKEELINMYRTQLHSVFKLGLKARDCNLTED